jgi:hypothetical protein
VNEIVTVVGETPAPCRVPDAMVWGLVDRLKLPELQLALPRVSAVAELHWKLTALAGTAGQLPSEDETDCTVNDQLPRVLPLMVH